jgi:hypothetical protein
MRESRGELRNLAAAPHGPLFERLNPLARLMVDHSGRVAGDVTTAPLTEIM